MAFIRHAIFLVNNYCLFKSSAQQNASLRSITCNQVSWIASIESVNVTRLGKTQTVIKKNMIKAHC